MFRPMKIHRQEVSFGVQALWYDVMAFKLMCSLELAVFADIFRCAVTLHHNAYILQLTA
jgi:hypothetical protein